MARFVLKSVAFRKEREAAWHELERLLARAESSGLKALEAEELYRLPILYRGVLSALSVARAISLDKNGVAYLESLAARAYLFVYGTQRGYGRAISRFFARTFPRLVWEMRGSVALAILLLVLGTLSGGVLTARNPDLFFSFVPAELAADRSPYATREALEAILKKQEHEGLSIFASALFTHNSQVGFLCFALGSAALPVALLLFQNGVILGAFATLHQRADLGLAFWGWVLPHGITELLAVCLCGGAGLSLARSLLFPGAFTRLESFARQGRQSATTVLGSALLFLLAGLIEGYFRQLVTADAPRLALASASALFWLWYFVIKGRREA